MIVNELPKMLDTLSMLSKNGSSKFRYAAFRNYELLEAELKREEKFREQQKSAEYVALENERLRILAKCADQQERDAIIRGWDKLGEWYEEREKHQTKVVIPRRSEPVNVVPYKYNLKEEDIVNIEEDIDVFKVLKWFCEGVDEMYSENKN